MDIGEALTECVMSVLRIDCVQACPGNPPAHPSNRLFVAIELAVWVGVDDDNGRLAKSQQAIEAGAPSFIKEKPEARFTC